MRTFLRYLHESPHETDSPVPVSVYLSNTAKVDRPDRVRALYQAFLDNRIESTLQSVPLALMVPTQATVSQSKVMRYMHASLSDEKPPVVIFSTDGMSRGGFLIIDGHHRVCGAAVAGDQVLSCYVLDTMQAQAIDASL